MENEWETVALKTEVTEDTEFLHVPHQANIPNDSTIEDNTEPKPETCLMDQSFIWTKAVEKLEKMKADLYYINAL